MMSLHFSIIVNIGSVILGLGAWAFACMAIASKKVYLSHRFSVASFSMCAFALVSQLFEISNRAKMGDFAAIEDTIRAIIVAAVVLVVITIVLNVVALVKTKNKQ